MTLATREAQKSANRWQESRFHRMPRAKGLGQHRKEKALASKRDQLRAMTTVVADTGDLGAVARLKPVDCTTNPTIVLNAECRDVVDGALAWGRAQAATLHASLPRLRLAVSVGVELLRVVPD